jgi:hypothetical protein
MHGGGARTCWGQPASGAHFLWQPWARDRRGEASIPLAAPLNAVVELIRGEQSLRREACA